MASRDDGGWVRIGQELLDEAMQVYRRGAGEQCEIRLYASYYPLRRLRLVSAFLVTIAGAAFLYLLPRINARLADTSHRAFAYVIIAAPAILAFREGLKVGQDQRAARARLVLIRTPHAITFWNARGRQSIPADQPFEPLVTANNHPRGNPNRPNPSPVDYASVVTLEVGFANAIQHNLAAIDEDAAKEWAFRLRAAAAFALAPQARTRPGQPVSAGADSLLDGLQPPLGRLVNQLPPQLREIGAPIRAGIGRLWAWWRANAGPPIKRRREWHFVPWAFVLLVYWLAFSYFLEDTTRPARPRPAPSPSSAERYRATVELSQAVLPYLKDRLVVPAPEGQVGDLAYSIAREIEAADIPPEWRREMYAGGEGGTFLQLWRVRDMETADLVPPEVQAEMEALTGRIRALDPLLLSAAPGLWSRVPVRAARYPEGFGDRFRRPRYQGPGELVEEKLISVRRFLRFEGRGDHRRIDELWAPVPEDLMEADILVADYDDGYPNTTARWYWYEEEPAGLGELMRTLPPDHPLREVGPPRAAAPDRLSQADREEEGGPSRSSPAATK